MSEVKIIDDFLSEEVTNQLYDAILDENLRWKITSDHDKSKLKKKSFGYPLKSCDLVEVLKHTEHPITSLHDFFVQHRHQFDVNHSLYQVYFNCIKPGEQFDWHEDGVGTTIILYINPIWKPYWGSGTKFLINGKTKHVGVKPGRCVWFDASISHKAHAPNILMNDFARFSIAFQFVGDPL